ATSRNPIADFTGRQAGRFLFLKITRKSFPSSGLPVAFLKAHLAEAGPVRRKPDKEEPVDLATGSIWLIPLAIALAGCRREPAPTSDKALSATSAPSATAAQASSATALSSLLRAGDAGPSAGRPPGARPRAALSPKAGERVPVPTGR